ncbi:hypothetical protein RHMOL_Rhmol05G0142400 [Rhododendron molle]|uniref:Uncharacterized protein n=1 Tax=Rhododendron molle TaxID=49168 RepID=A0ACC0NPZ9_RHOML|nr:hypothetical protein RHMOL_Rhmol05G0142400 [Rhododendron molle]
MSNIPQGGCPPFAPQALADYRSLLAPMYTGPTPPSEDNMELYEVPITYEMPPPVVIPEYVPPTEIPAPPVKNFEPPFHFPMFETETDSELEAAMLDFSQYYLEPLEEPPLLTKEELLRQEREYFEKAKSIAEKNHKKWLREIFGINLPQSGIAMV